MKKHIARLSLLMFTALTTVSIESYAQPNWTITGNANINASANFLGTTNGKPVIFKTNGIERMRLLGNGKFGIGTKAPQTSLHIIGNKSVSLTTHGYLLLGDLKTYNTAMDANNIQTRYNDAATDLYLNNFGGTVRAGNFSTSPYGVVAGGVYNGLYGYSYGTSGIGAYGYSASYFGVYGYTGGGNTGSDPNFPAGVHGYNSGYGNGVTGYCVNGAGVVGWSDAYVGIWGHTGNAGSWAGFFDNSIYTTGTYQGSDEKLKENINDFSSAMEIIGQLHPKIYRFRHDGNYKSMNLPQGLHYGLIAQDIEKTLPNLVKEAKQEVTKIVKTKMADPKDVTKEITVNTILKTGESVEFKAVNYTELIPIMIKGMQEQQALIDRQQQQIDELKQLVQQITASGTASDAKQETAVLAAGAYLAQNAPNPFSQNTVVTCYVPASVTQARLAVYNMKGNLVKTYKLSGGMNNINIFARSLVPGQYIYSLIADGKKVDSKNMVMTN